MTSIFVNPVDHRKRAQAREYHVSSLDHGGVAMMDDDSSSQQDAQAARAVHAGWVYKRGGFNPAFKKRWFVLRGGRHPILMYYKSKADADAQRPPRGSLDVAGVLVEADTGSALGADGQVYCFAIYPAEDDTDSHIRRLLCGCLSLSERAQWTKVLTDAASSDSAPSPEAAGGRNRVMPRTGSGKVGQPPGFLG